MTGVTSVHWSDLRARCLDSETGFRLARWAGVPILVAFAILAPGAFLAALAALALVALLWRRERATGLLLIALMGNVKINYYVGIATLFPEYAVIAAALAVWVLESWERPEPWPEPGVSLAFTAWTVAGIVSMVFAYAPSQVIARAILLPIEGVVLVLTVRAFRTWRDFDTALKWLTGSAIVVGGYGVVQMAGIFLGFDTSMRFLRRWGNPEFEYSVGAPVLHQLSSTFRANSFFNDPNILAGYLAAVIPVFAVRVLAPGVLRSRKRLVVEGFTLLLLLITLVLTLSRSGVLGTACGLAAALAFLPAVRRNSRLWIGITVTSALAVLAASAIGVEVIVLVSRLVTAVEGSEFSARVHRDLLGYGLELFARHPVTGVGLHNFSQYYQREVDPLTSNMMSHNMWLTSLAETGLFGFVALLGVCAAVVRAPWKVLRRGPVAGAEPAWYPTLAGLFGGLVAIAVTNVFYDFSTRTFVWATAGLAVAASRLGTVERTP